MILTILTIVGIPDLIRILSKHWKMNEGTDYLKIFEEYEIKED